MKDKNEIRNILNRLNYKELQRIWYEYHSQAYYYIPSELLNYSHISITELTDYIYDAENHFDNYELKEYFYNCDNEQDDNEEDF